MNPHNPMDTALNCNDGNGDDIYFETDYEPWPAGWLTLPAYKPAPKQQGELAEANEINLTQNYEQPPMSGLLNLKV